MHLRSCSMLARSSWLAPAPSWCAPSESSVRSTSSLMFTSRSLNCRRQSVSAAAAPSETRAALCAMATWRRPNAAFAIESQSRRELSARRSLARYSASSASRSGVLRRQHTLGTSPSSPDGFLTYSYKYTVHMNQYEISDRNKANLIPVCPV